MNARILQPSAGSAFIANLFNWERGQQRIVSSCLSVQDKPEYANNSQRSQQTMTRITYETWDGSSKRKPWTSKALDALLQEIFSDYESVHIVHAGTTASAEHYKRNPNSKHSGTPPTPPPQEHPPDAIDIVKVFVKTGDKCGTRLMQYRFTSGGTNSQWRECRAWLKAKVEAAGGKVAHATDKSKNHLHVQTK